ncbi:helix-turn-helix domain-containing protein [Mycobacterium sp.]|uniref:helix-turn-helix domain-containing protein n=1 Tax=Mycobacterium sp. TaxID=1785 RepID=UPI002D2D6A34|nr:helix-turn-helix domain-containing protein [Mycobacterium sp.]HZA10019.1 helix-turn-helix domain-containing protein [Mycobacterium sp.]
MRSCGRPDPRETTPRRVAHAPRSAHRPAPHPCQQDARRSSRGTAGQRDSELLTVADVAEMTRLSAGTLRYWRALGQGGPPSVKLGRRVMYRRGDSSRNLCWRPDLW